MDPLPARDLRSNLGTWAVVTADLPAVAYAMIGIMINHPQFKAEFEAAKRELSSKLGMGGK